MLLRVADPRSVAASAVTQRVTYCRNGFCPESVPTLPITQLLCAEVVEDSDRADPIVEAGRFYLIKIRPKRQGTLDVGAMVGAGKDNNERTFGLLPKPFEHLEARLARHFQIEHEHLWIRMPVAVGVNRRTR